MRSQADVAFRLVFDQSPIGLALLDLDGRFVWVNPAFCALAGYSEAELLEGRIQDITSRDDLERAVLQARRLAAGDIDRYVIERSYVRPDGTSVWVDVTVSGVHDASGALQHFVAHVEDGTARRDAELRLRREALHDDLTGLPNRRLVHDRLEQALAADRRAQRGVTVAFVDLDGFKAINDELGHAAGDAVLVDAARRLLDVVRPGDTVGRLGGDEFVVVCPGRLDGDADRLADRITEALQAPLTTAGVTRRIGATVGAVVVHGGTAEDAIATADAAMYRRKHHCAA